MKNTTFAERARANALRIKEQYNASRGSNYQTCYQVETRGLHNIWTTCGGWYFKDINDARAYAANEVKPTEKNN